MKKLCVLEQSGTINDPYTKEKKVLFETDNCDFYRLNWRYDNDPDATITAIGVLWSEGRSILYHSLPLEYEYYMFIDDDIRFHHTLNKNIDEAIINLLEKYQPLSATFYCNRLWGGFNPITDEMRLRKQAFPFLCLDLQVTVFAKKFAEIIFPIPFHGSDRCMWYAYWLANKLNPRKQVCFSEITVTNERSVPHFNQKIRAYKGTLVRMFNDLTYDKSFDWDIEYCRTKNIFLYELDPIKSKFDLCINEIKKHCNWESIYIKNRCERRNLFHKIIVEPKQFLMRWIQILKIIVARMKKIAKTEKFNI